MAGLSDAQLEGLERLLASAPDAVVEGLASAPASATGPAGPMAEAELRDRRAARAVFAPLLPPPSERWRLSSADVRRLWTAVSRSAPDEARRVAAATARSPLETPDTEPMDDLCRLAAALIRREPSRFDDLGVPAPRMILALELAPVIRRALVRLPDWLGRNTSEGAALARLAYRDATRGAPDAGPLFLDILQAHLPEPSMILRVIASVMGRPSDRFVAASELGRFGEAVLAEAEADVRAVQAFVAPGPLGAHPAAAAQRATARLDQLELAVDLARDGPWGERVVRLRRELAASVEGAFEAAEKTVAKALPLQRSHMKSVRGAPRLDQPLDVAAGERAAVLVSFLAETASALDGGYRAARARTVERLTERLAQYLEDLIERIHAREGDEPAARAHLELAASLYGRLTDERTAQAARRRAAAA